MSANFANLAHHTSAATLLVLCLGITAQSASNSPSAYSANQVPGRVNLDFESPVPAKVEVDLSRGVLRDMSGIARAAVSGALNAIIEDNDTQRGESIPLTVEQLNAVREISDVAVEIVHEVRIRVYEMPDSAVEVPSAMFAYYQDKLSTADWENVVRVRDGDENVNISFLLDDGAIRGVFIIVAERDEAVIVNAACELSPGKVEQLTNRAASIGLQFGLGEAIEEVVREVQRELR